ncbi:hydrolase [Solimonas marina]|uniref:Hydrolase n=1 Tax=Solimonas marina TaxID=2714601 RepID=A0A970B6P0_9GAMM|nr:hydrolase [Solimonas marina]NKF22805.1 hydrolase [Solimonas marina]
MDASHAPAHGRIIDSEFRPHRWLRGPHAQTIVPTLLRPSPPLDFDVETLELPDGDFVRIGWAGAPHPGQRVAVLVHGLTGGFTSKYLRGLAGLLIARGWRVAALELRGGGAQPNRLPRNYHHGDTGDLRFLLKVLHDRDPNARLAIVGWSLGANIVIKAMGEDAAASPVEAAAAASAPFLLEPCAQKLDTGFARLYQRRLLIDLKRMVGRKYPPLKAPPGVDLAAMQRARSFIEFDDAYTAPMHGFRDARDYYARCACGAFLKTVARPMLVINARDDPFLARDIVPRASELAPSVTLELTRRGGHVGFIAEGQRGRLTYWLETRLADWLETAVPADHT